MSNYLYRVESRVSPPGTLLLKKMADVYHCTMEELLSPNPSERISKLQAETFRRQARELEAKAEQAESGRAVGQ